MKAKVAPPPKTVLSSTPPTSEELKTDEFPIPVSADYTEIVQKADLTARIIDQHLDFEERSQGRKMRPMTLCPEQGNSLASDLSEVTR
ncbi:MAG: hypothetical protein WCV58_02190 [Patescibacteria group bacterium]